MNHQAMGVGSIRRVGRRGLRSAALGLAVTLLAFSAHANKYGEKHITSNTKLTDHQFGSVVFDADNISLDCNGYQVHISSYSKKNCSPSDQGGYFRKCGIVAIDKSDIKIRNCRVVGGFDFGVNLDHTDDAYMSNVQASAVVGFWLRGNTSAYGTDVRAVSSDNEGVWLHGDVGGYYDILTATEAGGAGVDVWMSTDTYINQPHIYDNGTVGLWIRTSDGISVSGGSIFSNPWPGVVAQGSDNLWFFDTTIYLNGYGNNPTNGYDGMGIELYYVSNSHFLDSRFTLNAAPCDVYAGVDSAWNNWSGSTIGNRCIYEEPR